MSTIGWVLPSLFAGELLASFVLGIPTLSPIFLGALLNQDMFWPEHRAHSQCPGHQRWYQPLLAVVDPRIKESV